MLEYALLGFLNYQPRTGYDLSRDLDGSTNHFWHAKQSQIYTTLKQLENKGMVVSQQQPGRRARERKVYSLTPQGREHLDQWLAQPVTEPDQCKMAVLLKLFFSARVSRDTVLTTLRWQRDLMNDKLRLLRQETPRIIAKALELHPGLERDARMWEATRRCGELHAQAHLTWLEETIALVEDQGQA